MIPFPNKKYSIIYADPPWSYNDKLHLQNEGAACHYRTMPINELKNLPLKNITNKDCILFIWVTMPQLSKVFEIIESWGFIFKTCAFCWIKQNPKALTIFKGLGRWVMGNAELCLLATKGHPHRIVKNIHQIVFAPRSYHSKKPDEVRNRIVQLMGDLPRIELFAREKTPGWDSIGYDIDGLDINESIRKLNENP